MPIVFTIEDNKTTDTNKNKLKESVKGRHRILQYFSRIKFHVSFVTLNFTKLSTNSSPNKIF